MKPYGKQGKGKPKKHWPQKCSWWDCYEVFCYKAPKKPSDNKTRKRKARAEGKKQINNF